MGDDPNFHFHFSMHGALYEQGNKVEIRELGKAAVLACSRQGRAAFPHWLRLFGQLT